LSAFLKKKKTSKGQFTLFLIKQFIVLINESSLMMKIIVNQCLAIKNLTNYSCREKNVYYLDIFIHLNQIFFFKKSANNCLFLILSSLKRRFGTLFA